MKIRMGFVSNSSSSSFVCFTSEENLINVLNDTMDNLKVEEVLDFEPITQDQYNIVKNDIKEWIRQKFSDATLFGRQYSSFSFLSSDDWCRGWPVAYEELPEHLKDFILKTIKSDEPADASEIITTIADHFTVKLKELPSSEIFIVEQNF